jgi:hypothetical protein
MDVLELPRPVINFLRTMSKEMHRYSLCWDIYGGTESVTLTLTWKINCDKSADENTHETSKQKHQQQISSLMNTELVGNLTVSSSLANSTNLNFNEKNLKQPPQHKPNASQKHHINTGVGVGGGVASSNAKSSSNSTPKASNKQLQHAKLDSLISNFCNNASKYNSYNNNQQQNYFSKQISHPIDFNENLLESFHAQNLNKNKKTPNSSSSSRLNLKPRNQSAESHKKYNHSDDEGECGEDEDEKDNDMYRVSRRTNSSDKKQQQQPLGQEFQSSKATLAQNSNTFQSKSSGMGKLSRGKSLESNEKSFLCNQGDFDRHQQQQNYLNNSIAIKNNSFNHNNNNNTTSCQLKRVIHHSNQKSNVSSDYSSYYEANTVGVKLSVSPKVVPISIRKEASFESQPNQPQQSQQRNRSNANTMTKSSNDNTNNGENDSVADNKNPWIRRNFAEGNNKLFKETTLITQADKDSILSLVESSAAPSSGSDVDGNEQEFDRNFSNSKFIESLMSAKNTAKNSSSNNNNNNNESNHSKVTFDPKLEFI